MKRKNVFVLGILAIIFDDRVFQQLICLERAFSAFPRLQAPNKQLVLNKVFVQLELNKVFYSEHSLDFGMTRINLCPSQDGLIGLFELIGDGLKTNMKNDF